VSEQQIKVALIFISIGIRVLSARLVLLVCLTLTFALFAWAMWGHTWEHIACATVFAVLVFLPATRLDKAQSVDRAVVSPPEGST
jgi:hypothetical protein